MEGKRKGKGAGEIMQRRVRKKKEEGRVTAGNEGRGKVGKDCRKRIRK